MACLTYTDFRRFGDYLIDFLGQFEPCLNEKIESFGFDGGQFVRTEKT